MAVRLYVIVLILGSVVSRVTAQEVGGSLEGRVLSSDGPLASAQVVASGPSLQGERTVASDDQGYFRLAALPVGLYTVRLRSIGFRPVRYEDVAVRLGRTTTLGEVRLEPQKVELGEIVVAGQRALIDPTSPSVGTNLEADEFELLPVSRNYRSIIELLPQANTSYLGDETNIAGATGQENAYYVDGINVTDPYLGVGGTNLPYNFIKEIDVRTGGYEAEYGRAVGGVVNVITHSGGNDFEAGGFGFFTHSALSNSPLLGAVPLSSRGFSRYDAGASVDGPIRRDRLWYFAAYDLNVESEDFTFPGLGNRPDRKVSHLLAGKLTWQVAPRTNVVMSVVGDPTTEDRIGDNFPGPFHPIGLANADPFLGAWERGGVSLSLAARHTVGERLLLETSLSRFDAHLLAKPATERGRQEPLFVDLTTGIWAGGYGSTFDHHTVRTAATVTGTYFLGSHTLKAGLQYEHVLFDEDWRIQSDFAGGAGIVQRHAESAYLAAIQDYRAKDRARVPTVFAQGSLQLHPRLRLNVGMRWERQSFRGDTLGGAFGDEWQPRVGFVYQPGKPGSQRVVGSYGRFYQQLGVFDPAVVYTSGLKQDFIVYDHDPRVDPSGGIRVCCTFTGPLPQDVRAEHHDEVTVGYERQVTGQLKVGVRGIHRWLREAVVVVAIDTVTGYSGLANPGKGQAISFPRPIRRYTALELTLERLQGGGLSFLASYVLSRNYGNYTGVYNSDAGQEISGAAWATPLQVANATGLLPNDRTHVFKFFGSQQFGFGLTVGTFFVWESGTPLSELGGDPLLPISYTFLRPRGTVGRMPTIWDWNIRLEYDLQRVTRTSFGQRVFLDLFHLFSGREPVQIDQQHYLAADSAGNQLSPNPNYGTPSLYQPPMSARLGAMVNF